MHLEERKLIKKYGERYLAYKKEVPALFPKIK
jgi:protein-S-isoprenylcysteine O-methyltransferase Ste14